MGEKGRAAIDAAARCAQSACINMKILRPAKPEHFFYCADGTVLRSIHELEKKLRAISNETYSHHVNESKNDFHNWIRDVFQEHELANEILTAKTQAEAAAIVRKHLNKAMQASTEIENAIKNVLNARLKTLAAANRAVKATIRPTIRKKAKSAAKHRIAKAIKTAAKVKKPKHTQQKRTSQVKKTLKAHAAQLVKKKRKVNKMTFFLKEGQSRKGRSGKRKKSIKKRVNKDRKNKRGISFFSHKLIKKRSKAAASKYGKKQVNKWLNWLRLVPKPTQ